MRCTMSLSSSLTASSPAAFRSEMSSCSFTDPTHHDKLVWTEQISWQKTHVISSLKNALRLVKPHGLDNRTEAYGAKKSGIRQQYWKFLPPELVPDQFATGPGGQSGRLVVGQAKQIAITSMFSVAARPVALSSVSGVGANNANASSGATITQRWSGIRDEPLLHQM